MKRINKTYMLNLYNELYRTQPIIRPPSPPIYT